jgi:hypothetical protein
VHIKGDPKGDDVVEETEGDICSRILSCVTCNSLLLGLVEEDNVGAGSRSRSLVGDLEGTTTVATKGLKLTS